MTDREARTPLHAIPGQAKPEAYIDATEMCRILGVSRTTLWRMTKSGEIPSHTWLRRTRRYRASEVLAALARAEMKEAAA